MKAPTPGMLAAGLLGVTVFTLMMVGPPGSYTPPPEPQSTGPASSSISVNGFTLTSDTVDLPIDEQQYPDGPHADVINANCTSCHSASMAMTQPVLSADQWKATVTKMKDVYKAPVAEKDIPAIVDYLTAMSAAQDRVPIGKDQNTAPGTAPDVSGGTG
ncbi:hypothetical protein U5A82_07230 [Sphingobium sp. CR2-8]|uniref:hypothetical protein n=1 Tax=Sphingobium sp. CR2-8 TaxID=1306534 RepID=UPI002DBCDF8F|nr:hypothetical protein [Sphingobium sp. CR2-8]MEC3910280.1 hypothetical protein [Sphingobium sp. CR2-8]